MTGVAPARFTAVVLAGSRGGTDPLAEAHGVAEKCLVPVRGMPMVERVLRTLARTSAVDHIIVTLERPELLDDLPAVRELGASGRLSLRRGRATPSLSVLAILDELGDTAPVLVTTADHPLLTPELVEGFCTEAWATGADVVAGLTPAAVIEQAYPGAQRTYLRFAGDRCSGANLFAILTPRGRRAVVFWRRVEQDRKRPWRIVRAFGLGPLLAYLLGRLTLDGAMARASAIIGARVAAVLLPVAEAAIDVDKPADLELVDAILARRG